MSKEIKKLADEISFRLLATRKHPDMDWLTQKLKDFKMSKSKMDPSWLGGVCSYLGYKTIIPTWIWRLIFIFTPGSGLWYILLLLIIRDDR